MPSKKRIIITLIFSIIIILSLMILLTLYTIPQSKDLMPTAATLEKGDILILQAQTPRPGTLRLAISANQGSFLIRIYNPYSKIIFEQNIAGNKNITIKLEEPGPYRIVIASQQDGASIALAGTIIYQEPVGSTPYSIYPGLLLLPLGFTIGLFLSGSEKCERVIDNSDHLRDKYNE